MLGEACGSICTEEMYHQVPVVDGFHDDDDTRLVDVVVGAHETFWVVLTPMHLSSESVQLA